MELFEKEQPTLMIKTVSTGADHLNSPFKFEDLFEHTALKILKT